MNIQVAPLANAADIGLALAVWLAHDEYNSGADQHPGKNIISATGLLKSTRQLVLSNRVPPQDRQLDVSDLIPARLGHAIHDSVETAWRTGYQVALSRLGYPQKVIDRIRINPTDQDLAADPNIMPVYLEQRHFREIDVDGLKVIISGQMDHIIMGELNDTKTTSAYAWVSGDKEEDYRLQGSIYRWINPTQITQDIFRIQHVFTDWQRSQARINPNYPQSRIVELKLELLDITATENWIKAKIREIIKNQALDEPDIVRCSDHDLWMSTPQFKYYADPKKAAEGGRSTKNFPNYPAAAAHCNKAGKGVVVTVPSQPKACGYCAAFDLCSQKDEYEINQKPEDTSQDD